jgi:hypothetical protein
MLQNIQHKAILIVALLVVVGVRVGALYFAVKVPTLWRNILPPSSV